ncbi:MAG: hypothetical protein AB8B86_19765 [Pseudomonadales bacterium]
MEPETQQHDNDPGDSSADAMAAVALILLFVVTASFWILGQ